jgi:DNA-binding CsgD family transcriptional regulator
LKDWIGRCAKSGGTGGPKFSDLQLGTTAGCRLVIYCGATRDGDFVMSLLRERPDIGPEAVESFGLTRRESEILFWMSESKTNPEIATILGISPRTIQKHAEHLFSKIRVSNRLEAQRLGLELRRM